MHKENKSHTSWSRLQLALLASRAAYPRFYNRRAHTHTHSPFPPLLVICPALLPVEEGWSRSGTMLTSAGTARRRTSVSASCVYVCVSVWKRRRRGEIPAAWAHLKAPSASATDCTGDYSRQWTAGWSGFNLTGGRLWVAGDDNRVFKYKFMVPVCYKCKLIWSTQRLMNFFFRFCFVPTSFTYLRCFKWC